MTEIIGKTLSHTIIGGMTAADNCTNDKMRPEVKRKEQQAIKFLQSVAQKYQPLFLAYSGGKDSEVVMHLAQKAGITFQAFYNSTTIDPPGTISYIKSKQNVTIKRPRRDFFTLIRHRGLPSAFQRFCCDKLKEEYYADYIITGVRQDESQRRRQKYTEPDQCHVYKHGQRGRNLMPILYWTDADIENYINSEHIQCHPKYYDSTGKFNVKARLGCLACPLRSDKGIPDFKRYPKLLKQWCRNLAIYRNSRKSLGTTITNYRDEYENLYHNLYNKSLNQLKEQQQTRDRYFAWHFLQQEFNIELPPPQSPLEELVKRIPTL